MARRKARRKQIRLPVALAGILFLVIFLKYSASIAGWLEAMGGNMAVAFTGALLFPALIAAFLFRLSEELLSLVLKVLNR